MKKNFIFTMVIILIYIFSFSFVFANENEVDITTNTEGTTNSIENSSSSGTDSGTSSSSSTLIPSTGDDYDNSSPYTSSNPDDRENNNIKRTLSGKEVSKADFKNPEYEYEYETTKDGNKIWVGTLRSFSISDLDHIKESNNTTATSMSKSDGCIGISVQDNLDYINQYFKLESYQYVGEEFTITGLGTFACQGIETKSTNQPSYYVYTCKITNNDFRKSRGKTSYFELLEKDVATGKIYLNWLKLSFTDEHNSTGFGLSDNSTGIYLYSNYGVIPENTTIDTESITSGDEYDRVKTILDNTVSKMYVYDISLKSNGAEIQPNEEVEVTFTVPNDVDTSKLTIYRITENGEKIEYDVILLEHGNTEIRIETSIMGTYVLAEKSDTENNINLSDDSTGIKLNANTDAVPENTTLVVKSVTSGDTYKNAKITLGNTVSKIYVYDISLESKGVEIQPNGKVKISIPIPNDLDTSKLVIFRITDNGEKIEYTATIETIDGIKYATFETDHFSTYVLAEKTETTNKEQQEDTTKEDNTKAPGILPQTGAGIGLTIVVIVAIGMSVLYYMKYRDVKDI